MLSLADSAGGCEAVKVDVNMNMSENNYIGNKKVTSGRIFSQDGLAQVPPVDSGIKRCGYCDMLVRWTSADGRNVATNADGSRHQCRINGTAKRDVPVRHDRATAQEVIEFLNSANKQRKEESAAGPVTGAGGSGMSSAAHASLPNHPPQQQQQQPPATSAPATAIASNSHTTAAADRDAAIKAMHEANIIAAWKAQAEATNRLADAIIEVARSVDALARSTDSTVTSNYRLADEVARLTHLLRGIVAAVPPPASAASPARSKGDGQGVNAA